VWMGEGSIYQGKAVSIIPPVDDEHFQNESY
jgi:hypothetical protein